jgi:membrane-bound lytic murein transglycosylase F
MFFLMLPACEFSKKKDSDKIIADLHQIKGKKKITAVTLNTSTSYFIYKMQRMGYEYDLIEDFACSLEVDLNIKVAENITRLEEMLLAGEPILSPIPYK